MRRIGLSNIAIAIVIIMVIMIILIPFSPGLVSFHFETCKRMADAVFAGPEEKEDGIKKGQTDGGKHHREGHA